MNPSFNPATNVNTLPSLFLITILAFASFVIPVHAEKRIGLSLPFTGTASLLANQFSEGFRLALQEYNRGIVSADEKALLFITDDACSQQLANLAADEIIAAKVDIVTGLLCNEASYLFAEKLKASQTPILVAGAQSSRLIKDREREEWNVWRLSPGDRDAPKKAAELLSVQWAGKPYALVDDGTVYGRNLVDEFRALMEEKGLPPQFQDNFRPTESTQARLVRRLQKAGVTHVFVGAAADDVAMISRNAAELSIPLTIAGGDALGILPYVKPELKPENGLLAILPDLSPQGNIGQAIEVQLTANGVALDDYVLKGYQAAQIAIAAIGPSHGDTTRNLEKMQFDSILGPVKFGKDGANTNSPYALFVWQGADGGKFVRMTN